MKNTVYALPTATYHLKTAQQFKATFQHGNAVKNKYFTLIYAPNQLKHPRLGFAVAKNKVKKAVMRNTVKRWVKESFRLYKQQICAVDIVFLATVKTPQLTSKDLFTALEKIWDTQLNSEKSIDLSH